MANDVRSCLGEDAILAFVAGTMTGPVRRSAEVHLASCGECRTLVSELARRSGGRTAGTAFAVTLPSQPPPALHTPVLPGDVVAGKYEVEWTIGAGGMGVVVAALHRLLGQRVAIKFPSAELRGATEGRERLLREARACARLRSEHTVRVLDVGTLDDGAPYIVMEYLLGRSLADRLREEGPLRTAEAVDTVRQACAALEEAHAAGIVHRDLKPSNLVETRRFDGTRLVKVLDFGIAKGPSLASGDALTSTRGVMGSPGYMAPEQLRSTRDVDARADLWALGVTLHELLTGELGPRADGSARVQPEALERVVRRCLEHDPSRRFGSARELSDALAPFGPSPGAAGKGSARRASVAWWIPVVALVSAGAAGGATWFVRGRAQAALPSAASASPLPPSASAVVPAAPPVASEAPSAAPSASPAPPASSAPPAPAAALASAAHPSTAKPPARILAPSRPPPASSPGPASTAVDPHGLSDRK